MKFMTSRSRDQTLGWNIIVKVHLIFRIDIVIFSVSYEVYIHDYKKLVITIQLECYPDQIIYVFSSSQILEKTDQKPVIAHWLVIKHSMSEHMYLHIQRSFTVHLIHASVQFNRKLKKVRREKTKLRHKMDMKMVIPGDRHDFSDDVSLFNLNKIKSKSVSAQWFTLSKKNKVL